MREMVQRRLRPRGGGGHEQDDWMRSPRFAGVCGKAGRRGFGREVCRSPPSLTGFPAKAHLAKLGLLQAPIRLNFVGGPGRLAGRPTSTYILNSNPPFKFGCD
jgi:hypothetical protein